MIRYVLIGIIVTILVAVHFRHMFVTRAFPSDTIRRVLHHIIKQSDAISSISSPHLALIQSRECQASLQTLVHLTGCANTLNTICGIDTETLQNILYHQETSIERSLKDQSA